jgi:hypothetical protein
LSSILDALKKADRDSSDERSKNTPWSSQRPVQQPNRQNRLRWWAVIGFAFVSLTALGLLLVTPRDADPPHRETAAGSDSRLEQDRDVFAKETRPPSPAVVSPPQEIPQPVAGRKRTVPRSVPKAGTPIPDSSRRKAESKIAQLPAQSANGSTQDAATPSTILSADAIQQPVSASPPDAEIGHGSSSATGVSANANADEQEKTTPMEQKKFKNDPRIELQALVWAEKPADRFVVINNQLLKEGGTIDTIVVEKINPDDIRLAEGNLKWYQAFQVR